MPIYEYECAGCGGKFERLVKTMSAADGKNPCPKCGSTKTQRKLSAFAVNAGATQSSGGGHGGGCGCCGAAGTGQCPMNQ